MSDGPYQASISDLIADRARVHRWRATKGMGLLVCIALLLGGEAARIVPGRPFISIFFDVCPLVACIIVIWHALLLLRDSTAREKAAGLILIALATLGIAKVLFAVVSFWITPNSRGDLIGF
jgi:hypothetical protein